MAKNHMIKTKNIELYLKKLVSFNSTNDNLQEQYKIVKYLYSKYSKKTICKIYKQSGSESLLIGFNKKSYLTPEITFHGHLDIVSAKKSQLILKKDRKYFIGRGVQDMKGGCAVFMTLIDYILESKQKPNINFLFTTDEEIGGFNGTAYVIKKGLKPKFVITGESTNLQIGIASKGVIWVKIISKGISGHSAYIKKGQNALVNLINKINIIKAEFPDPKKQSLKTTVNIAYIKTKNKTFNKVPDYAEVALDIRYFYKKDSILKLLNKLKDNKTKLVFIENEPPTNCNKKNNYLKKLQTETVKNTKNTDIFIKKMGASDLRHFAQVGIPGVEFGPIGQGLHSNFEQVNIKSLKKYSDILLNFINKV